MEASNRAAPNVETPSNNVDLINILLVEDNPADICLTREVFADCRLANNLEVARNGLEAMELLRGTTEQEKMPDIILLDLNMPKMDGREVLQELKKDSRLCTIPVIILTTSDAEQDVLRSYQLGVNCYITKPVDLNQFIKVVQTIEDFWLAVVKLPPRPPLSC
ncbi:response regulator [Desulfurivibrio dismutans]|uniref:response regulator n=1 Tax=Desulfurivibrio dismutans TaxID=1398908 RepID=UPI0023DCE8CB|nr:response regulator [Desulfurivibrio alkaliphilus]MDF1613800.1 response regulator [Desulfurivibrio alkaliphilus]